MKYKEPTIKFERLNDFCLAFRMKNLFISDNKNLFIASSDKFCRTCFTRRYLTQVTKPTGTSQIEQNVLNLAKQLDKNLHKNELWRVVSVEDPRQGKIFEFTPYEDCHQCGRKKTVTRGEAMVLYKDLLRQDSSKSTLDGLVNLVFSFGFAAARGTTKTIGLDNPDYDKLLGDLFHASIVFRMIASGGRPLDSSSMGVSPIKELAELKSLMEYLERYAYMMQLCRFKTDEFDEQIINSNLALYRNTASKTELSHIKSRACWGINLSTKEIRAIPLAFIFNKKQVGFIKPCSSGFAAHTNFRLSLCSSILELVERDAFVRFWYEPTNAYNFEPDEQVKSEIESIMSVLKNPFNNEDLTSNFFVIQSPTKIPVVLITISSNDFSKPPSLSFGCGVGFDTASAISGAIEELRINAVNLVKGISVIDGFLTRKFSGRVEDIQDRANFYATNIPRAKLKFLDKNIPLIDGIVEDVMQADLNALVERFKLININIYGIDCTPRCFQDKNAVVTRAFSPQLYPLQFEKEDVFKLPTGISSSRKELPHFFL